jgi:hypothetical protein
MYFCSMNGNGGFPRLEKHTHKRYVRHIHLLDHYTWATVGDPTVVPAAVVVVSRPFESCVWGDFFVAYTPPPL